MEPRHYTPSKIEKKWQQTWAEQKLDQTLEDPSKPKFYALSMFPYPSGKLHMGHVRNYTITDVIARVQRMRGYRVLHPMGWDAFGLPAENAAIDRGVHPAQWTTQNVAQMKEQLAQLGLSYDWDREVATCSPDYYRWTQWLFLEFYRAGLAYQQEAAVNWDPIDQTVLANEQVDAEGRSWRSGALVEKKLLRQWFLKITAYAEPLLQDLEKLTGWPDRVRLMQENWIGKSTGARVVFKTQAGDELPVFTTRPDTLWGATFMVLSPEHPLVEKLTTAEQAQAVADYRAAAAAKSEIDRTDDTKEKTGVFTGSYAINPVNQAEIPIWIADYVLMGYGTGAIMAVPAHDQRDFDFARRFGLAVKVVVQPDGEPLAGETLTEAWTGEGTMVRSGPIDGVPAGKGPGQSVAAAIAFLEENGFGAGQDNYRLRDWLISRQRYWGVPIPMIHCGDCGIVPVPDDQLPVLLPENVEFSGRGASPLAKLEDWVNVSCPCCGKAARRETDTMDTFIDSSWYFFRYADAQNQGQAFDREKVNNWLPVDQYVGGIEHAILHLLYSRFFTKVLRDRGLVSCDEPFTKLLTQGMVQASAYKNPSTGKYIPPEQIADLSQPTDPATGETLEVVYEKMSKSKYNGVDPQVVLAKYGADTARMFILFKAPPEKDLEWDDADVEGQFRFLNRVWRLVSSPYSFWSQVLQQREWLARDSYQDFDLVIFDRNLGVICVNNYPSRNSVDESSGLGSFLQKTQASFDQALRFWEFDVQVPASYCVLVSSEIERESIDAQVAQNPHLIFKDDFAVNPLQFLSKLTSLPGLHADEPLGSEQWDQRTTLGVDRLPDTKQLKDLRRAIHTAIQEITEDLDGDYQFNTAVSELMKLSNALQDSDLKSSAVYAEGIQTLVKLLAPFAPHIAEELWQGVLAQSGSIHQQAWPVADPTALVVDEITLVIQVMGKKRGTIAVPASADQAMLEQLAKESEVARMYIGDKTIRKTIVVPGKLVNFVVG